ncbi:MAG: hypothetical protein KDA87_20835 [Planctomycetales bacterium]|nr:hypothetical protein [Planctomycetales bacterium]
MSSSGTVHVQSGFEGAYDAGDKLLAVAYEDGPTLIAQMNPLDPTQRELVILGTEQRDKIDIQKGDVEGAVEVRFNEKHLGKFKVKNEHGPTIERIVVYGLGSDDDIKVHKNAGQIPTELYGGPGNDKLRGGEGDDYLSGGDGDDVLSGQAGRDIMIGGLGSDKINGDDGDDILVGGVYIESENRAAIHAISHEWSRTDLDFASRVDHLLGGGGLNEGFLLNATTAFDDNAKDKLRGKKGLDWFMSDSDDDKTDADLDELLTEIEFEFVSGN